MDEHKKKSFDLASDATKQLITLATAIVALTVTLVDGQLLKTSRPLFVTAWIVLLMSILFGIGTLLALTGELASAEKPGKSPSVAAPIVRLLSCVQIALFLIGMGCVVASAVHG